MGRLQKCRLFQKSRAFFDECWGAFPALFLAEAPSLEIDAILFPPESSEMMKSKCVQHVCMVEVKISDHWIDGRPDCK